MAVHRPKQQILKLTSALSTKRGTPLSWDSAARSRKLARWVRTTR
jgi:hypothetical protein